MSQIQTQFTHIEAMIRDGVAVAHDAMAIDMRGLDAQIESLCQTILALPPEERRAHETRLRELLAALGALGEDLQEQIAKIKDLPTHRNASIAYKTADSRDNFGKRDNKEN